MTSKRFQGLYDSLPPPGQDVSSTDTPVPPAARSTAASAQKEMAEKFRAIQAVKQQQAASQSKPKPQPKPRPAAQSQTTASQAANVAAMAQIDADVTDPYDVTRPNDYEEYCRMRTAAAKRDEQLRRAKEAEKELEQRKKQEQEISGEEAFLRRARMSGRTATEPPKAAEVRLDVSGEEAFLRRARMSGKAIDGLQASAPAPGVAADEDVDGVPLPCEPAKEGDDSGAGDGIDGVPIEVEDVDGVPWNPTESERREQPGRAANADSGIGRKIMMEMGWKDGKGLGKLEQGMTAPLVVKRDRENPACGDIALPKPEHRKVVILLTNMISVDEIDEGFQGEVEDECAKFGKVVRVVVHVLGAKNDPSAKVRVFVRFETEPEASAALQSLNGRYFAGRMISASIYDMTSFEASDFSK